MKNFGFLILAALMVIGSLSGGNVVYGNSGTEPQVKSSAPTEVYYFHMSRRCITCQAVETVTEEALKENFAAAMKSGQVTFKSINLEDKANKELVKKMKVSGQALLIVNGKEKIDITDKGFLYAKSEPDKLKSTVKETIGKFLQ
jgi:thiol-disulfide isomerase/thioredoxin